MFKPTLLIALVSLTAFAGGEGKETVLEDWAARPHDKFEGGARAFDAVKRELLDEYVKNGLDEDDLYRAAAEGMLAQIDPSMRPYNKLLSPKQNAELLQDMKGEVVGVGVQLKFDEPTGRAEVMGVMKGGPAEKADLRDGDIVLTVDGQSFKGKTVHDLVGAVRGKIGEKVTLSVLRDNQVITKTLERQRVSYELVTFELLPNDVGVIAIHSFGEGTPDQVRAAISKLQASKAKGLIVDLRGNEGGLLEKAMDTAKLMLPKGKVIARLAHRGGKEEVREQTGDPMMQALPTVVLIDKDTRSSAELVAAALREGLRAPLIGAKTAGKWSVQALKELPNHFVMRYTVALFKSPDNKSYEAEGLPADIEVAMDEATGQKAWRAKTPAERVAIDVQLRAAANFLRLR
ncbi:MAG: S41 family peptidase [Myxococcaceae bacterium]